MSFNSTSNTSNTSSPLESSKKSTAVSAAAIDDVLVSVPSRAAPSVPATRTGVAAAAISAGGGVGGPVCSTLPSTSPSASFTVSFSFDDNFVTFLPSSVPQQQQLPQQQPVSTRSSKCCCFTTSPEDCYCFWLLVVALAAIAVNASFFCFHSPFLLSLSLSLSFFLVCVCFANDAPYTFSASLPCLPLLSLLLISLPLSAFFSFFPSLLPLIVTITRHFRQ